MQLGTYRMVIGPNIADVNGNLMNQDGDNINGEPGVTGSPSPDAFQASFTLTDRLTFDSHEVPLGIFDWTVSISRLTIEQDMTVGDLNLQVNINHSYVGDLRIMLVAPDGTQVRLISPSFYRGGANFTNTVFDDEAGRTINQGQAPYTGSYRPQQPLSALDGKNARGSWELRVEDFFFIDEGVINSWSVTIVPAGSAGVGPLAVGGWGSGALLASVPLSSNNPGLDRSILDNLGAVLALPDDAMPAELPSPDQPAVPPPDGETIDSFFVDWGREEQDWVAPLPTRSNLALPEEPWEEFLGETPGLD
jgi:subtilisin-like proprotein convertase family protein